MLRLSVRTFRKTADTITLVGQQSWVTSLLRTQENSAAIADTQHELTQLISVLNVSERDLFQQRPSLI